MLTALWRLWTSRWPDAAALAALVTAAFLLERDFLGTGNYLPLRNGDWLAHAYRARVFQEHGLTSWDHSWAGGLSPFQSYQFVPHAVTAVLASIADASIGRTMLFIEGALIIWVRVSGYPTARLLGLPPAAALLAGVVTFGVNDYGLEVASFSSLSVLALAPLFLITSYRYANEPTGYAVACLGGLSIYVHPHLFVLAALALFSAFLLKPQTPLGIRRLALQGALMMGASALFWMPVLFSAKPVMQDPTSADVQFLRRISGGEIERFSDAVWLFMPLVVASTALFWNSVRRPLFQYVTTFFGLVLFLIALSYAGAGSESLRLMQNVRLMSALALPLGLAGAIALDAGLRRSKDTLPGRSFLALVSAVAVAAVLAVPFVRFADSQPYRPGTLLLGPAGQWIESHRSEFDGRLWLDDVNTSLYTYLFLGDVRISQSHFGPGEYSLLAWPQQQGVLAATRDFPTTAEYLKAMAVTHLVIPSTTPFAQQVALRGLAEGWVEEERFSISDTNAIVIYRTPWAPLNAFVTSASNLPSIEVSHDDHYKTGEELRRRDEAIGAFNELAYSPGSRPAIVDYTSAATMKIRLESVQPDEYLVVGENWDHSWDAETSGGEALHVDRYGPNYIGIDLSGIEGDAVIELRHEMPWDWKFGAALTLLTVPAAAGLMLWERRSTED